LGSKNRSGGHSTGGDARSAHDSWTMDKSSWPKITAAQKCSRVYLVMRVQTNGAKENRVKPGFSRRNLSQCGVSVSSTPGGVERARANPNSRTNAYRKPPRGRAGRSARRISCQLLRATAVAAEEQRRKGIMSRSRGTNEGAGGVRAGRARLRGAVGPAQPVARRRDRRSPRAS